jgi:hypothetical protein
VLPFRYFGHLSEEQRDAMALISPPARRTAACSALQCADQSSGVPVGGLFSVAMR